MFKHKSVLLNESIESLNVRPEGIYVDGTAGGGGHSLEILKKLDTGCLIAIDQDPDAINFLEKKFENNKNIIIINSNFANISNILKNLNINKVDGVFLDIGVSSYQLDTPERGFSYKYNSNLDMRMSQKGVSAYDLINELPEKELSKIIYDFGEEKFACAIAKAIVKKRSLSSVKTTSELSEIIKNAVPAYVRRKDKHPAKKTFQAIRIAVNDELNNLSKGLDSAFSVLKSGGILSVITFHSLEDRIVKNKIKEWCSGCTCPSDFPICVCGNKPKAKISNKKFILPSEKELEENPRSRSAKLRICEKI